MDSFNVEKTNIKRPELLKILCILTFIFGGISLFSFLYISISYNFLGELSSKLELNVTGLDIILSASRNFYILGTLLYVFVIAGAIKMWNLKKIGFHFYSISKLLLIALPLLFKISNLSIFNLLFTVIFILLYYKNLKFMT